MKRKKKTTKLLPQSIAQLSIKNTTASKETLYTYTHTKSRAGNLRDKSQKKLIMAKSS